MRNDGAPLPNDAMTDDASFSEATRALDGRDEVLHTLLEGIEEHTGRIAAALEQPTAPAPAPVVQVAAPVVQVPPAAPLPAIEFTFHRDQEGRLCGCTATPK